jgi:uncharacterized protein involved in outer membrane biogenesis
MASAWYRSKGFLIAVILLALVVGALLVAPYVLDLDRYRPTIVELLKKETGRDVAIEKIRLHFLPLRVEVLNFRLLNPPDFPPGDTLAVGRIALGLAWRPLLSRQVEIDSVSFEDLALNLLENEARQTNYDTLDKLQQKPKRKSAKVPDDTPPVTLTQIDRVALDSVEVSAGTFRRGSKKIYPAWRVTGLAVEARHFDFTRPDWQKQVEAEVPLGKVELSTPSLREPLRVTRGELTVKNNAAAGEFGLAVGKLRANGRISVADLAKPVAEFHLTAAELNVAELTALLAPRPAGPGSATGPGGGSGATRLVAKGTVEVKELSFPPVSAENLRATVRLYTTRLEVDPLTLVLYGGTGKGTAHTDLAAAVMTTGVNFTLDGVNVAQAIAAANPGKKSPLTGTLESKMHFEVKPGAASPLATLTGQGSFAVRNGTFPGMNLGSTLGQLAKFLQIGVPEGDTRFSRFGGDLRIAGQRVHSQSLKLDAEDLEAALAGSVGFDKTLDYTGWGILKGGAPAQAADTKNPLSGLGRGFGRVMTETVGRVGMMRVPFSVRGTTDDPKFSLAGMPQPVSSQPAATAPPPEPKKKKRFGIF